MLLTGVTVLAGWSLPHVGDEGALPDVPFTWETLTIITPYALGVANVVTGFFGGMGGCAMIGQTMINVTVSGARTRLSTFLAGVFLLVLVVALGDVVATIPMAALVAVMIFVSIATFDWHRLRTLHRMPRNETAVMLSTVAGRLSAVPERP